MQPPDATVIAVSHRDVPKASVRGLRALFRSRSGPVYALRGPRMGRIPRLATLAFVAVLGAIVLALIWLDGFGTPNRPVEADDVIIPYLAGSALLAYGALGFVRRVVYWGPASRLRFGIYVLASDLALVAREGVFIVPSSLIASATADPAGVRVSLTNGRSLLVHHPKVDVPSLQQALATAAQNHAQRPSLIASLASASRSSELPADLVIERKVPLPLRYSFAAALLLSLSAFPILSVRNNLSDAAAVRAVYASESLLPAFEYSMSRGGSRAEVRAYLMEGEYEAASADGRAEALTSYLADYPDSPFREDAQRQLYDAAFDDALGNTQALRAYLRESPESPRADDARRAIAARFQEARDSFAEQSASDSARSALIAMLNWLEAHDEHTVTAEFRSPTTTEMQAFDTLLQRHESGVESITPYLNGPAMRRWEDWVRTDIGLAVQLVVPSDLMQVRVRPVTTFSDAPAPTFRVDFSAAPSGRFYASDDGPMFAGVTFVFSVALVVPNAEPFEFRLRVAPPNNFSVFYSQGESPTTDSVYGTMIQRAFGRLGQRIVDRLFRPGSDARQDYRPQQLEPD